MENNEDIKNFDLELRRINQNEFNIVSWCGVGTTEVKHSAMIADLLNPRGAHGCREIPLKLFLNKIGIEPGKEQDLFATTVETEKSILDGARRGDIFLKNEDFAVVIENKTESSDHHDQLKDYSKFLEEIDVNEDNKKLVYLTYNDGDKPNEEPPKYYCHLSYETNIIDWLNKIRESYIPEETKIAVSHYSKFLSRLLNKDYQALKGKVIGWAKTEENIAEAKKIIASEQISYLPDTVQWVYEGLCQYYCEQLLRAQNSKNISISVSVSECSLSRGSSAPFRCTCTLENENVLEFFPLACSKHNYGKLYVMNKDGAIINGCLCDKQWNCNFFEWLYDPENNTPEEQFCADGCSISAYLAPCSK